jgi:hypothetical protein
MAALRASPRGDEEEGVGDGQATDGEGDTSSQQQVHHVTLVHVRDLVQRKDGSDRSPSSSAAREASNQITNRHIRCPGCRIGAVLPSLTSAVLWLSCPMDPRLQSAVPQPAETGGVLIVRTTALLLLLILLVPAASPQGSCGNSQAALLSSYLSRDSSGTDDCLTPRGPGSGSGRRSASTHSKGHGLKSLLRRSST